MLLVVTWCPEGPVHGLESEVIIQRNSAIDLQYHHWARLLYICFPVASVTEGRLLTHLIPSLKPQITEAAHRGMFILEWVDCCILSVSRGQRYRPLLII